MGSESTVPRPNSATRVHEDLLDRQFTADAPNRRWVGDTTQFVIGESGKLYLAAILDLFSRFVVGWAVSAVNDRHLTIKALTMARTVSPAAVTRRWSCSTTSKCSITNDADTRRSAKSVQQRLNGGRLRQHNE